MKPLKAQVGNATNPRLILAPLGATPDGLYKLGNVQPTKTSGLTFNGENYGFTISMTPVGEDKIGFTRSSILIHSTFRNTHGCIGIIGNDKQLLFEKTIKNLQINYDMFIKVENVGTQKTARLKERITKTNVLTIEVKTGKTVKHIRRKP